MKSISLRLVVSPRWDVSPHISNPLLLLKVLNCCKYVGVLIYLHSTVFQFIHVINCIFNITLIIIFIVNTFHATGLWFSDVFRGFRKRPVAWNGLIRSLVNYSITFIFVIAKLTLVSRENWLGSTKLSLREKFSNTEFFLVRIQENRDQKKFRIWTLFMHCLSILLKRIRGAFGTLSVI